MNLTSRSLFYGAIALVLSQLGSQAADAASVSFTNINQSTQTPGDPPNLYGPADLSSPGQLLFPSPNAFVAQASGPGGFDVTDSLLTFMVQADPGTWATGMSWFEGGSWSLVSNPPGFATAATNVRNSILGFITIVASDIPVPVNPIAVAAPSLLFDAVNDVPPDSATWQNGFSFDFTPYGKVTKFNVSIDNRLIAFSQGNQQGTSFAFIDKKVIDIDVETGMIPEPTSAALLGLALASFGLIRRKQA